jgi:outer membrane protein OmpU
MKKLLIATTALVATAGIASADITITGSANAGVYSGLSNKDAVAKVKFKAGMMTTTLQSTAGATVDNAGIVTAGAVTAAVVGTVAATDAEKATARNNVVAAEKALNAASTALTKVDEAADLADAQANLAAILGTPAVAASAGTYTGDGVYSNAGIVATMTGATDGGITFSASVDAEAGTEVDTGDFELDGAASGMFGLGAVSMTGGFGTVTFDDGGIDNLYDDDLTAADVSYSTSVGNVTLTAAMNAQTSGKGDDTSLKAAYTSGGMSFTGTTSDSTAGTSASVAVSYVVSDNLTVRADTDQAAGAEAVQSIGLTTALNGVSIVADSSNNSTWDVSLGYTVNGVALSYAADEASAWSASASYALGGGATAKAGVNSESSMYAGVSFAF